MEHAATQINLGKPGLILFVGSLFLKFFHSMTKSDWSLDIQIAASFGAFLYYAIMIYYIVKRNKK